VQHKNKLVGSYLPVDMLEQLDTLAEKRHGIPRTALVREALTLLFEKEEMDDRQRKARRLAMETAA
jgi:metal-responsive CopG/Arc/MetJ family transcriptional regulator